MAGQRASATNSQTSSGRPSTLYNKSAHFFLYVSFSRSIMSHLNAPLFVQNCAIIHFFFYLTRFCFVSFSSYCFTFTHHIFIIIVFFLTSQTRDVGPLQGNTRRESFPARSTAARSAPCVYKFTSTAPHVSLVTPPLPVARTQQAPHGTHTYLWRWRPCLANT